MQLIRKQKVVVLPTLLIRTIRDFATRQFRTLLVSLTPINGPANFAIVSTCRQRVSFHKWTHVLAESIQRSGYFVFDEVFD